jgi:glycosyltransferase involved in cell wall biosynthesis
VKVTVITPTMPRRHEKLQNACRSLQNQTFKDWTHLIVPNGYDGSLDHAMRQIGHTGQNVRVVPLGRPHPTPGHWNRVLGGLLAETPYIAYLDDDNLWRPRHLEVLIQALEENPKAGFAYSQAAYIDHVLGDGNIAPGRTVNNIDASLVVHRVELLSEIATWDPHHAQGDSYALDGMLVDYWLRRGVQFVFVPEITVDYLQVGYWVDGGGALVATGV